ncbi:excinuclease ABC subunit UvrC [Mesoplasma photuris]|uniref:excinuclease ABC subunit UvrC n=1 Tax=Mesoplasma photuris TaxID=217731 RepID=UPI0004E1D2D7|nr:excinuclease ABC subunit UvrC [Mesoplasma photuris]
MNLEDKVKNLPDKPGCYIYYNKDKKVIYVGKAKNLNKRVGSYFNRVHNIKTTRLVREIFDLDYFVVKNEMEALILEENLIKKYRPRFNILLNDDKAYPYITITNEKDPQYKYVRKYNKKSLRSYGPFPLGSNAREIMTILERIYPLRRCKGNLGKPCIYFHIDQCSGACFKEVDQSFYKNNISQVDKFFKGNVKEVEQTLINKMQIASNNLQFEEAQRIKETIKSLKIITFDQNVELNSQKDTDVFNYHISNENIALVGLFFRGGKLIFKDEHIQEYFEQDEEAMLFNYIDAIYTKNNIPHKIIVPKFSNDILINDQLKTVITKPINKEEIGLIELAYKNAEELNRKSLIKSLSAQTNKSVVLKELQTLIDLNVYPNHIEMFDISNIGNEFVTGSCVVYKNGVPSRNDFRKYNIEIEDASDYHRVKNMIYRRFQKALVERREMPDLIIMDGGIIQINAAKEQLNLLGLEELNVIGLVKDDHHKTDHLIDLDGKVVNIKSNRNLYNFLSGIQIRVDEYAKSGFRKKQNKKFLETGLEKVTGLGDKKIQNLYKKFDSLENIKNASFEELNSVIKNTNTTNNLIEYLKK